MGPRPSTAGYLVAYLLYIFRSGKPLVGIDPSRYPYYLHRRKCHNDGHALGPLRPINHPKGSSSCAGASPSAGCGAISKKSPTAWDRILATVYGILATILLVVGSLTTYGFTFALIAGSLVLIYFGLRPRKDIRLQLGNKQRAPL